MDQPGESGLETFLLDSAERGRRGWHVLPPALAILLAGVLLTGWYWSREPELPDPAQLVRDAGERGRVPGAATTLTLLEIARTLQAKPGGYLANDRLPPGVLLDNMPAWELGALTHVRDMSRALRRDLSRSPSQSIEDPDLARAEPRFNFDSDSWLIPSSEGEYASGVDSLHNYFLRLTEPARPGAAFFPREDNLARWLEDVNSRLASYAQRLGAAVEGGLPADIAAAAGQAGAAADLRTPWVQLDDVFYETRGYCWALLAQLRAAQVDFAPVLAERDATASLAAVIRELEGTQRPVWSPLILNGSEYGVLANHSLVMANYVARANAGVLLLRHGIGRR